MKELIFYEITRFLLHDFIQGEVSQERVIAELTVTVCSHAKAVDECEHSQQNYGQSDKEIYV
jgi:hypothetical protein